MAAAAMAVAESARRPETKSAMAAMSRLVATGRRMNQSETFTRNEDFWGEKPKIKTLGFSFFANADTMALALKSGTINALGPAGRGALRSSRS